MSDRSYVILKKDNETHHYLSPNIVETVLQDFNEKGIEMFDTYWYIEYEKEECISDYRSEITIDYNNKMIHIFNRYTDYDVIFNEPHTELEKDVFMAFEDLDEWVENYERLNDIWWYRFNNHRCSMC